MQRTWDIDTGISLLATQAVEGHRCAAQARDAILGHRLYDTRFPFLAKTGFQRELCRRFWAPKGGRSADSFVARTNWSFGILSFPVTAIRYRDLVGYEEE